MKGKEKCDLLNELRQKIADENNIDYHIEKCTFEGECLGTCPKCEADLEYLEEELIKKQKSGEKTTLPDIFTLEEEKHISISKISRLRFSDENAVFTLIGCMGCPLRCAYCFNPFSWDNSLEAEKYSIDELYDEVKIDNLYFLSTGGGLVFGGGEPLLYSDFIRKFIEKYNKTGWKFVFETSLNAKHENLVEIIDYIDYFIVDIKDMDKKRYELYTQGDYDLFISNLNYLLKVAGPDKIRIRIPRIPKLNTQEDVNTSYDIVKNMGFKDIEIFDYIEIEKYKKISPAARENKQEFLDKLHEEFIRQFIISEIILKVIPIFDFKINKFPEELWKNTEFIFEYDSIYKDRLKYLKEAIVSKLQECYDYLGLKYSFYVILYSGEYLKGLYDEEMFSNILDLELDKKEIDEYVLNLWQQNKFSFLEFKRYCNDLNQLNDYFNDYSYEIDSKKYILSKSYETDYSKSELRIFIKKSGKKYNIVEYEDATHVLVQKFNVKMEIDSQEICLLKNHL